MFDIGASELLLTAIVAIIVIGPKDLPLALRTAGRWIGKVRRVSNHFRAGVETMIREAELEEMEKQWREQNARIMAETSRDPAAAPGVAAEAHMEGPPALPESGWAEALSGEAQEPELPLGTPPPP